MRRLELPLVVLGAAALSILAVAWFFTQGYTLYFGDAESHLNIARRIIDSRTPGVDQFGTGWLPLLHALLLPFVANESWWRSGLAGAFAPACAFVGACTLLYAGVRQVFPGSSMAAMTAVAVFALNPNILYLQSIPMTESVFFAALIGLLCTTVWFHQTGSVAAVFAAAVFSNAASLTRYDGWFLIPFATLFFFLSGGRRRWWAGLLFGTMAALTPLGWLAYNWWFYRNPLEFYNGEWSTKGIYERALKEGMARQPGDHNWSKAVEYFWAAATLTAGAPLAWIGLIGSAAAVWRRVWWPVVLLALTPVFYVCSMYSSGAQIFVPQLWPNSYYNTRYGTAMMPLLALGAAALVTVAPGRIRVAAAGLIIVSSIAPWLLHPQRESWACWMESKKNSDARRAWTAAAAGYFQRNYKSGDGVFTQFGDWTGIYRTAGIPLRETLHEGNNPQWMAAGRRPDLFLKEEWAVSFSGGEVARAIQLANRETSRYALVQRVVVPGVEVVEIYRRSGGDAALTRLCNLGIVTGPCEPGSRDRR